MYIGTYLVSQLVSSLVSLLVRIWMDHQSASAPAPSTDWWQLPGQVKSCHDIAGIIHIAQQAHDNVRWLASACMSNCRFDLVRHVTYLHIYIFI